MQDWWDTLGSMEHVYWIIALIGTLLLLVVMVTTFMGGGDADMDHVDAGIDADTGIGMQFFTFKNLVGFLTMFAWSGLACIRSGLPNVFTVLISLACGVLMMFIMAWLFKMISKQSESGTLQIKNAVNKVGEVYTTIKKSRGGMGKVQVEVQGSLRELEAMTDDAEDLVQGNIVRVVSVVSGELLLVEKFKN